MSPEAKLQAILVATETRFEAILKAERDYSNQLRQILAAQPIVNVVGEFGP